jgi:hypothetical protein
MAQGKDLANGRMGHGTHGTYGTYGTSEGAYAALAPEGAGAWMRQFWFRRSACQLHQLFDQMLPERTCGQLPVTAMKRFPAEKHYSGKEEL